MPKFRLPELPALQSSVATMVDERVRAASILYIFFKKTQDRLINNDVGTPTVAPMQAIDLLRLLLFRLEMCLQTTF